MSIKSRERLEWEEKSVSLSRNAILVAMRAHGDLLLGNWGNGYRAACELHEDAGQLHQLTTWLAATPGILGKKMVYGVPSAIRPVQGLPPGFASYQFCPEEFAVVTIHTPSGQSEAFWIEEKGEQWIATQFRPLD